MLHLLLIPFLALGGLFHSHQTTYTKMVDRVQSSIIRVTGEKDFMTQFGPMHGMYVCTGEVIDQDRVLTAGHCAGDAMTADGQPAKLLKVDEHADLALLETATHKPFLHFSHSHVKRFDTLTAIGYAFGINVITVLDVKAFLFDITPPWEAADEKSAPGMLMQNSVIGGMSGGPIVNQKGQQVGIVQQGGEGISYGVDITQIEAFLEGVL